MNVPQASENSHDKALNRVCIRRIFELLRGWHFGLNQFPGWIAAPLVVCNVSVTAYDSTLPSSHRAAVTVSDVQ